MTEEQLLEPRVVVERTGLTLDTLRYYEREGLVGPIGRHAGKRRYTEDDIAWISLVTCLRAAGLGISDLRRFTELLRTEGQTQGRVAFLHERRKELLERLHRTQAAITALDSKIDHYERDGHSTVG